MNTPLLEGMVFDIQRMSLHDGPGIRTTVFLKGCPLRCLWCHNPEGITPQPDLLFQPELCVRCNFCVEACLTGAHRLDDAGNHEFARDRCDRCFRCTTVCAAAALTRAGQAMTVDTVMAEVVRDRVYYEESGGGMTLGGGEPLAQYAFACALLEEARTRKIHSCVETCGFGKADQTLALAGLADLILFDWKESDPVRHQQWTGVDNAVIRANLALLDRHGIGTILRCPLIPGMNFRPDHIEGIAALARSLTYCRELQLLPYHGFGRAKYPHLGRTAPDCLPDADGLPWDALSHVADHLAGLCDQRVRIL